MSAATNLKVAIGERRLVKLRYRKDGRNWGVRIGAPYAIYEKMRKSDHQWCRYLRFEQTSGATDSWEKLPGPRTMHLEFVGSVEVLDETFDPPPLDPAGYGHIIAIVK